jgi:hypothetical protein
MENETIIDFLERLADRLDADVLDQAINLWFTKTELEIEKLKLEIKQLKITETIDMFEES